MSQANNGKRRVIASVQRAVDILNLFDARRFEMGTTEIARALDLPKSTVAGLVQTLEVNSLLEQNSVNRKYRLGVMAGGVWQFAAKPDRSAYGSDAIFRRPAGMVQRKCQPGGLG
jgi:hypothetical protein